MGNKEGLLNYVTGDVTNGFPVIASDLGKILGTSSSIPGDLEKRRMELELHIRRIVDVFGVDLINIYRAWKYLILTRAPKYSLGILGDEKINIWLVSNLEVRDNMISEMSEFLEDMVEKDILLGKDLEPYIKKIEELDEKYRGLVDFCCYISLLDISLWDQIENEDPVLLLLKLIKLAILYRSKYLLKIALGFWKGFNGGYEFESVEGIFGDFGEIEKLMWEFNIDFFRLDYFLKSELISPDEVILEIDFLLDNLQRKVEELKGRQQVDKNQSDITLSGKVTLSFSLTNIIEVFWILDYVQTRLFPLLYSHDPNKIKHLEGILPKIKSRYFGIVYRELRFRKRASMSKKLLDYFWWIPINGIVNSIIEYVSALKLFIRDNKNIALRGFDVAAYLLDDVVFARFRFLEVMEPEEILLVMSLIDNLKYCERVNLFKNYKKWIAYIKEGIRSLLDRLYEPYYDSNGDLRFRLTPDAKNYHLLIDRMIQLLEKLKQLGLVDSSNFEVEEDRLKMLINQIIG